MDNQPGGVNCPRCQALNASRHGRCEACGSSLEWASWVGPRAPVFSKKMTAAAFLLGGMLMGAIGTHFHRGEAVVVGSGRPQVDVVFVIDTTGSMVDEIDVVKSQVQEMMNKVQSGQPRPLVRFGLVAYRDRGDEYVTRSTPLTEDVSTIQKAVNDLVADGGGDIPESVNEALHAGVQQMNWDPDQKTRKLMFLIGDAGPHMDYANDFDYRTEMKVAASKGIKVHAWGCSGIDECGEPEFREIAALGHGDFQFLTYRQEILRTDGSRGQVVFQGKRAYDVENSTDWKAGADKISASSRREIEADAVSAPSASAGPSFKSAAYRPAPSGKLENNLDRVLTEQVMEEARSAGTKY